ncbi:MAG: phosphoglycerate dehydrogenase [Desulfovibrionaceae bacterium]
MKVLITAPYFQPVLDRFRPEFEARGIELVVPPVRERLEEAELLGLVGDIDGVICGDDRFTRRVIEAAPRLKVLSKWGTGIDSLDQAACRERGVAVRNTRDAFSQAVGDTVLGLMLSFARNIPWMDRAMKRGHWEKIQGRCLHECTLGVVGVGDTGSAVVRRAKGFGMRLLGNDIREIDPGFCRETGLTMTGLDQLLAEADFVSANCDLNPTSHHLFTDERFARMKPGAVFINCARGPVMDQAALIRALQAGRIAGAGLDVFEDEPLPADSPLLQMDNVLLSPHNANSSPAAWERIHRSTLDHLFEELFRD